MRTFLLTLTAMLASCPAFAGWTALLPSQAPEHFFAEDKGKDQLFRLRGEGGAASIVKVFASIHGRVEGDKQVQGDLKTPEGVYFITHKITEKLDFMDYGPHAFALNYPNPMDRILGKTGGGIWLHSKGQPIKGIQTRGCVAIGQEDITSLVPVLTPGTPVLIAQELAGEPFVQKKEAEKPNVPAAPAQGAASVASQRQAEPVDEAVRVLSMAKTWMEHTRRSSEALFSLYDSARWQKASREPFSSLMSAKRRDFSDQKDQSMREDTIRLLAGPGYWVTFFPRTYTQGSKTVQGTQVLYWAKDGSGAFRIIGDFWAMGAEAKKK